jgi:hexosaminidase
MPLNAVRSILACALTFFALRAVAYAAGTPALVPAPLSLAQRACSGGGMRLDRPLRFPRNTDDGGFEIVRERWTALGIPAPIRSRDVDVRVSRLRASAQPVAGSYTLDVGANEIGIGSIDGEGVFDALATLAQLPVRTAAGWALPCTAIVDRPALRWRVVSDDISRGPFPTQAYFKERIRTLASFKINGYSPYMEQVFADAAHPYVAFPDALTAAQLHDLAVYARRFHVALIPEQQTFAHMHETLKYEQLANLAETPHGYLLAASDPATHAYLEPLLRAEHAAVGDTPFFHLGVDEPLDLGRGRTPRTAQVLADHITRVAQMVSTEGTRPMIWDDAIQRDSSILHLIPKDTVIATFHYGAEASFAKYITTVADAGFAQMISPGANNWNEIFPDLATAYANEGQFIADGKSAHVLGMFETVWHDDGETLYEATWAPLAFAAASAWQTAPVDRATWHAMFARAFFGSDDPRFAHDLDALENIRTILRTTPGDPSDYLFWSDPFDTRIEARMATRDLAAARRAAEDVLAHLAQRTPPLHANAAAVMRLAALRYDDLGRRFEIGKEARDLYADALAHLHAQPVDDGIISRDLNIAKYLCWELRDELTALEPLYAHAWRYESTPNGLERMLVRYHAAAAQAMTYADRLNTVAREEYLRAQTLPTFEEALGIAK